MDEQVYIQKLDVLASHQDRFQVDPLENLVVDVSLVGKFLQGVDAWG